MDMIKALSAFSALSQETRLSALKLLVQAGDAGLCAGEISTALNVRQNTLSTNLSILVQSGLVRNRREGRTIRYQVEWAELQALITYMLKDCCGGRMGECSPIVDLLKKQETP